MAHFAQLDSDSRVMRVVVVDNARLLDEEDVEQEELGLLLLRSLFGDDTIWKQTSYNGSIRKNFASIGGAYDADLDAFIPPMPFPSWVLNHETCQWQAPVPKPDTEELLIWDESSGNWVQLN